MPVTTQHSPIRRAHTVTAHPTARTHRREVIRWALAHGHPVSRDALTVIVALRTDRSTGAIDTAWRPDDVARVVNPGAAMWCSTHRTGIQGDLASTLSTYIRYLSAHRLLDADRAAISSLHRAVTDLPRSTSRARHPSQRAAAPVVPIS